MIHARGGYASVTKRNHMGRSVSFSFIFCGAGATALKHFHWQVARQVSSSEIFHLFFFQQIKFEYGGGRTEYTYIVICDSDMEGQGDQRGEVFSKTPVVPVSDGGIRVGTQDTVYSSICICGNLPHRYLPPFFVRASATCGAEQALWVKCMLDRAPRCLPRMPEEIADIAGICEREKRMCEYTRPHGGACGDGIMARIYI